MASIMAGVLAYYLSGDAVADVSQWMAGDPVIYQDIYRGFEGDPILFVLRLAIGFLIGVQWLSRWDISISESFGIPGVLAPYSEASVKNRFQCDVYVNGEDELGQLARLEVFTCKLPAATLKSSTGVTIQKRLSIRRQGWSLPPANQDWKEPIRSGKRQ